MVFPPWAAVSSVGEQTNRDPRAAKASYSSGALTGLAAAATMRAMPSYETRTRRFSRAEYERLIELGVFQPGEAASVIPSATLVPSIAVSQLLP
jgi:hypothetical protein